MPISTKKIVPFEILIATMHRTSLSFLEKMFQNLSFLEVPILIVNQSEPNKLLVSNYSNIRVVNSFERGLPQSRNIAIENAKGEICLIADDDVVYDKELISSIKQGFEKYNDAAIVTYQMTNFKGQLFRDYPDIAIHNIKTIATANSVVIAFKRKNLLEKDVWFNPNFGLGATFQSANEYVFLRNALKEGLKLCYLPKVILAHEQFSSGQDFGSDRITFARAALFYKYSGNFGYLKITKDVFLAWQESRFPTKAIFKKLQVAFSGIATYKALIKEGKEIR